MVFLMMPSKTILYLYYNFFFIVFVETRLYAFLVIAANVHQTMKVVIYIAEGSLRCVKQLDVY